MILPDMLIKEVVREKVHLQYTWNLGIVIYGVFFNYVRIMELKNKGQEIYFQDYGFLIYLCKELKKMQIGLLCAQMNVQGFKIVMEKSSINYINHMNKKKWEEVQ